MTEAQAEAQAVATQPDPAIVRQDAWGLLARNGEARNQEPTVALHAYVLLPSVDAALKLVLEARDELKREFTRMHTLSLVVFERTSYLMAIYKQGRPADLSVIKVIESQQAALNASAERVSQLLTGSALPAGLGQGPQLAQDAPGHDGPAQEEGF